MLSKARFILSRKKVLENYNEIRSICDELFYSHKTNPDVSKVLKEETDCKFSVHSITSVKQVGEPKRVWYFAQAWNEEELNQLFELGVDSFVVDNENDLNVLLNYIKDKNKKINLLLRMRLKEHTLRTGRHFVYGMFSNQINRLIPELRNNPKIELLGVHFHRKTQNIGEWSLKNELEDSLSEETLSSIQIINIGGGIPARYKNSRPEVKEVIFKKIRELKEWINSKGIKMVVEPGRYIAASAVVLEAEIMNIYNNNIIINCSLYNSAMDTYFAGVRLLVKDELESGTPYTIKGCTPDSIDIFRYKVFLKDPKVGDKIIFLNAGAYNYWTNFCNLPKLDTVIVDDFDF